MANAQSGSTEPVIIKKYANRRLYNTSTSSYVTLDDLAGMVRESQDFVVYDAKTNEDITRSVLTQIIVEEESKGTNLLPVSFLRQLIALYGDSLQALVPKYLEHSMSSFTQNQERMRQYINNALGGMFPFGSLEELSRRNMEFLDQAFRAFNPLMAGKGAAQAGEPAAKPATAAAPERAKEKDQDKETLTDLQKKIDALEKQIEAMGKKE
ncbi:MAG: polyhydroxyalkanoate synthesis repressor PhaR [Rhodospirillaceae bacterium]|nr:polyhydroxyalkanoate synthesis repressor PhaR [Rhodospirillaceae bacterium]